MDTGRIQKAVLKFIQWLDHYGEVSWDHQSFYAGRYGRAAKALYYRRPFLGMCAVAPMVLCEALAPSARRFFWKKQRFPIADAHYAMGFAHLFQCTGEQAHYDRAVHFLNVLESSRCPGYSQYCWGYPFDWQTRNGTIPEGTPLVTITPYAYEAFLSVEAIDSQEKWRKVLGSIAEHTAKDIKDFEAGSGAKTCTYTPSDEPGVVNASAYRSFLLTHSSRFFGQENYHRIAEGNLIFVLNMQNPDGSWPYARDSRSFVDHFHTCFVLKALAKIEKITGHKACGRAIDRGLEYYVKNLFDDRGLVKPFAKAPRLTVYKRELYDIAECLNLGVLLKNRNPRFDERVRGVLQEFLERWPKPDGSFRSRELFWGWDSVPMHRWGQSQIFRSLCLMLLQGKKRNEGLA